MQSTSELLRSDDFGETYRTDSWWSHPVAVLIGLSLFVIYATFRVIYPVLYPETAGISYDALLSPFFAPLLFAPEPNTHAIFGLFPTWWPELLRSPAILILWAPLGLRVTCYYYRKAYYRAFFQDPPACAVGEPRENYEGERNLLVFQNLHRIFLYLGIIFVVILTFEAFRGLFWGVAPGDPFWTGSIEFRVGTIILAINAFLLAGYTFGCHSLRYLIGGNLRCFSCPNNPHNHGKQIRSRYHIWKGVTKLNVNHATWAWFSLFWVAFTDFYVWMVSIGVWESITIVAL